MANRLYGEQGFPICPVSYRDGDVHRACSVSKWIGGWFIFPIVRGAMDYNLLHKVLDFCLLPSSFHFGFRSPLITGTAWTGGSRDSQPTGTYMTLKDAKLTVFPSQGAWWSHFVASLPVGCPEGTCLRTFIVPQLYSSHGDCALQKVQGAKDGDPTGCSKPQAFFLWVGSFHTKQIRLQLGSRVKKVSHIANKCDVCE